MKFKESGRVAGLFEVESESPYEADIVFNCLKLADKIIKLKDDYKEED